MKRRTVALAIVSSAGPAFLAQAPPDTDGHELVATRVCECRLAARTAHGRANAEVKR
jgi:hypothetical protein